MKLDIIELQVKNWEEMVEWYSSILDLKVMVREDDHRFALLRGESGAMLGLFWVENPTQGSNRFILYFRTDNLENTVNDLKVKAVNIGKIQIQHWGKQAKIKDPEGNECYLYEETRNF